MEANISEIDIALLSEWLDTEEHLPHNIHKEVLKRFLTVCDSHIETTKKLIEENYTYRNKYPAVFLKRDPKSEDLKNIWKYSDIVILPGLTPENGKVIYYNFAEFDPDDVEFDGEAWARLYFMLIDVYYATPDPNGFTVKEIHIFDAVNMNLKKMRMFSVSLLRSMLKFVQTYHTNVLKEIHFVNCPSYLSAILMICKPFINRDVYKMFHAPTSQTIFDYVPRKLMPNEFGGNAGTIDDLKSEWISLLDEHRNYLMDPNRWAVK